MAALFFLACTSLTFATVSTPTNGHTTTFLPNEIVWSDGPITLPQGAKIAILEGNPAQEGPFTLRLKFPTNYQIPAHSHPGTEHITVISGKLNLGTGNAKATTTLPPGGFALLQPNTKHFAIANGETIIQLHGRGPWAVHYVNSKDDPRNQKA